MLEHLISRLDMDPEVEAQWDALADARQAELDSGAVKPVTYEDAITRLEARFPG